MSEINKFQSSISETPRNLTAVVMFLPEIIKMDHARINVLCEEILCTPETPARNAVFAKLAREMQLHIVAEEEVLYSLFAEDPQWAAFMQESVHENRQIEERVHAMRWMNLDSAYFESQLATLQADFMRHAIEEEQCLLPLLEKQKSAQELVTLTRRYQQAKLRHEHDDLLAS